MFQFFSQIIKSNLVSLLQTLDSYISSRFGEKRVGLFM